MGKEMFNNIPSKVGDLLNDVKNGKIGLPDLQRPFVWNVFCKPLLNKGRLAKNTRCIKSATVAYLDLLRNHSF